MGRKVKGSTLNIEEEIAAVAETGLYESREAFLADAVHTILAARPDLREAVSCRLYEKGTFSLGRAAEWAGISVEAMKEALHRRGIDRTALEDLAETQAMAREAMKAARRPAS
jgi:predicted HTH domain antitoxin